MMNAGKLARPPRSPLPALGLIALLHATAAAGWAWEADVHLGLTQWLALRAGFSPTYAAAIAAADHAQDEGTFAPAPSAMILHVMLFGDVGASRHVRDVHFPNDTDVPAPPAKREVLAGSDAAKRAILKEIAQPDTPPTAVTWQHVGAAFHALQDSWSHRGVPDSPLRPGPRLREELAWAHPESRGGWYQHAADKTYLHVEDTLAAAAATYTMLTRLLAVYPQAGGGEKRCEPGRPWAELEPRVLVFARAESKEEKRRWFATDPCWQAGDPPGSLTFVASLSLPGGPNDDGHDVHGAVASWLATLPAPQRTLLDRFLSTWLVQRNPTGAAEFVDTKQVMGLLAPPDGERTAGDAVARILAMWLIRDHGLADEKGHAAPGSKGFWSLPVTPAELGAAGVIQAKHLDDIVVPIGATGDAADTPLGSGHVVALRLKHTPRDTIALLISAGDRPRIIGLSWAAM